jgi:hypothetical protein
MVQDQVVPLHFGQGVDTKTDPKAVVAGKWIRLEDGVFTNPMSIRKRNGYAALSTTIGSVGSLSSPKLVHEYKGELLAADQNLLISYSPSQSAWVSRGRFASTELSRSTIDNAHPASGYADVAVLGNYALYGWSTAAQQNVTYPVVQSSAYGSVVDLQTGVPVGGPQLLSTADVGKTFINPVRVCCLGGSTLAIFYVKNDQSAIVCRLVTFSSPGVVVFGSELTVTTNYAAGFFDVLATSSGAAIFYKSTTGVTLATVNTSGAVTGSVVIVDAAANALSGHVAQTTNGNLWIYWVDNQGVNTASLVYAVYSSALASVLAKTAITTPPNPTTSQIILR